MADEKQRLRDLLEEIIAEAEDGELDPDSDLTWENYEPCETDGEIEDGE